MSNCNCCWFKGNDDFKGCEGVGCPSSCYLFFYMKITDNIPNNVNSAIKDSNKLKGKGKYKDALVILYLAEYIFLEGNINKDRRLVESKRDIYEEIGDIKSKEKMDDIIENLDNIERLSKDVLSKNLINFEGADKLYGLNTNFDIVNVKKDIYIEMGDLNSAKATVLINKSNKIIYDFSRDVMKGDMVIFKEVHESYKSSVISIP